MDNTTEGLPMETGDVTGQDMQESRADCTKFALPEPGVMCDCGGNYFTADQMRALCAAASHVAPPALSDEQIKGLAVKHGTRYRNRAVPDDESYGFMRDGLLNFSRALLAASRATEPGK